MSFHVLKKIARIVLPQGTYDLLARTKNRIGARLQYERKLRLSNWNKFPPVFVYQIGRVGSTTVYESLKNADLPYTFYHFHFLSHQGIRKHQIALKQANFVGTPRDIIYSKSIRKSLDTSPPPIVRIITLTRDPIRQRISSIFEKEWGNPPFRDKSGNIDKDLALTYFRKYFQTADNILGTICSWFDREFKPALGVDVYAHPFNQEQGFTIFRQDDIEVLIMKMEDLSRCLSDATRQFLNLKHRVSTQMENVTVESDKGRAYQYVLPRIHIPAHVLDEIYNTEYARHFGYTVDKMLASLGKR
jgi:hypothetical protein